ncbi:hypothetical protein [Methanosarcina barkeri]|uniref:hypothetical protein n=1 Tax=Methanosarcina barkeri TaxID=2208 RepID=UPI000A9641BF|nr:hypothetical protein [Methanosarcina barkeri]
MRDMSHTAFFIKTKGVLNAISESKSLYCDDCGFEVMVTKECSEDCKKEGYCAVE